MDDKIVWKRQHNSKKSKTHTKIVFQLYSPRKFTTEPATSKKIDTEVAVFLTKNSKGTLQQNLKLMKLMNFFMEGIVFGLKY